MEMVIEMQLKARLWKHGYKKYSPGRSDKGICEDFVLMEGISVCMHMHHGLQEVNWEAAGEVRPQRFPVCFVMLLRSAKCILRVLTKWSSSDKQTFISVRFERGEAISVLQGAQLMASVLCWVVAV